MAVTTITKVGAFSDDVAKQINDNFTSVGSSGSFVNAQITGATITGTVTVATGASLINPSITGAVITGTVTVATGAALINPSITGAVITGTVTVATGAAITNPSITGAVITGTVTVASGATLTTPKVTYTATAVTATGTTATDAATLTSGYPAVVSITGATGSGVAFLAADAVPGAWYQLLSLSAANIRVYSSGATINGTTGTTAAILSTTGNKCATVACVVTGAWIMLGNT